MKLKDLRGYIWKVYIEDWGHAGIPKDQYKLDRTNKIMHVFVPVRQEEDITGPEGREQVKFYISAYLVGKWRGMTYPKNKPWDMTKYVAQQIVNSVGSNVGHVADNLARGDAESGEIWISVVTYD